MQPLRYRRGRAPRRGDVPGRRRWVHLPAPREPLWPRVPPGLACCDPQGKVQPMEARQRRAIWTIAAFALIGLIAVTVALVIARRPPAPTIPAAIHKIKHVVIVMQENRSFDNYFGTYPGAAGIPMKNGVPTVCNADPKSGQSFIFRI